MAKWRGNTGEWGYVSGILERLVRLIRLSRFTGLEYRSDRQTLGRCPHHAGKASGIKGLRSRLTLTATCATLTTGHPCLISRKETKMNDFSNALFLSADKEQEYPIENIEIGKEEIRIPISIEIQKPKAQRDQRTVISTAFCEITGISISLLVPDIPLSFDYENPLAKYRNAIKLSQLSRREQLSINPSVLAGVLLTFLETGLLIDHIGTYRAFEFNSFLTETLTQEQLVDSIFTLKKILESKADKKVLSDRIPHIHFSRNLEFQEWLKLANEITFPEIKKVTAETIQPESTVKTKKAAIKAAKRLTIRENSAVRRLTKELQAEGTISNKAAGIFLWLTENEKSLIAEQKAKYVLYLTEKNNEKANSLAVLISRINGAEKEINLEDEIIPEEKPALSFLEKLALKRKGNTQ